MLTRSWCTFAAAIPVAALTGVAPAALTGVAPEALTGVAPEASTSAEGAAVPERTDVSDDGRISFVLDAAQPSRAAGAGRGSGPGSGSASGPAAGSTGPFGTTPDWQNTIRRQVGGVQIADLNGDTLLDVVAVCYQSSSFPPYDTWVNYIYFNTGGALETEPSWISTDEVSSGDVQVADFDNDGFADVFCANGGFAMSPSVIYYGGPGGPSTTPGWSSNDNSWNNHALPIDIDQDGDIDVVTANQGNGPSDPHRPIHVFRNVGGVLGTTPSWSSAETSIQGFLAAGDLDGDGWQDVAVSKWSGFESGVYRNLGGTLSAAPVWTTGDTDTDKGVGFADITGDGLDDVALGHDPTQVFFNTGGSLLLGWSASGTFFGQQDLRIADVDDDGDLDLAEVHFSNGVVNIYLNSGGVLSTTPAWSWDSSGSGTAIAFGDITGDGRTDLVVGNSGDPSLFVFHGMPPACPGDIDGSGGVGFADLNLLLANWGPCAGCPEDLDGSATIGFTDLNLLLAAWGPC